MTGRLDLPDRRGMRWRRLLLPLLACVLVSCGGGGPGAVATQPEDPSPSPVADITVLMMGNSHTGANQLPQLLQSMLRAGLPGRTVATVEAPGWMFLDERLQHAPSLALLRSRPWSAVVLQAQKYSTSGQFSYSTFEAEELVRLSRSVGALPVLFPEWPRRGVPETDRIHDLHESIAAVAPACVAPIGHAWDLAAQRHPFLILHAGDGNHSSPAGAYLAALVLYATLTGASPHQLPDLDTGVDVTVQQQLRQVAADTVQALPPRRLCPRDAPLAAAGAAAAPPASGATA